MTYVDIDVALDADHEAAVEAEMVKLDAIRDNAHSRRAIEASADFMRSAGRLPTLWNLDDDAVRLMALAEIVTDPEELGQIDTELALIDQMMMEKTEGYVSVMRSIDAMADAREAEGKRMIEQAKSGRRHSDWLRQRLLVHMQTIGQSRLETTRFSLVIRNNPVSVNVLDEAEIPSDFKKTVVTTTIDKRAIADTYRRNGEIVPGTLIERSKRLEVK